MVIAAKFNTFDDIIGAGAARIRGGDGAALLGGKTGFLKNLKPGTAKQVVLGLDASVDAASITAVQRNAAGQTDDTANRVGGHLAERRNELDALKNGYSPDDVGALSSAAPKPVPKGDQPSAFSQGMSKIESGFGYVAFAPLATEMALPALGGIAGVVGAGGLKKAFNAPGKFLSETHVTKNVTGRQFLNDGIQIGFTALQTWGVVKGFTANMTALKEMYQDITGKDKNSISTMAMLTSTTLPPLIAESRDHFIKEYGVRGLIQAVGWGLVARDLMRGKFQTAEKISSGRIGIVAGIVPGLVGMGADMLIGTATTEVYSGFKKAFDAGQQIGANEYAAFILASNKDLNNRKVGKQVALEIGEEYAQQNGGKGTSPGEILRQMNDGRFKARVSELIVRDEAKLAEQTAAKAQAVAAKPAAKQVSMVDKVNGAAKETRPSIGKFTSKLSDEQPSVSHSIT